MAGVIRAQNSCRSHATVCPEGSEYEKVVQQFTDNLNDGELSLHARILAKRDQVYCSFRRIYQGGGTLVHANNGNSFLGSVIMAILKTLMAN